MNQIIDRLTAARKSRDFIFTSLTLTHDINTKLAWYLFMFTCCRHLLTDAIMKLFCPTLLNARFKFSGCVSVFQTFAAQY